MEPSFQTFAAIRYGYGLSPVTVAPTSISDMLDLLRAPDELAARYPIAPFTERAKEERALGKLRKARRNSRTDKARARAVAAYRSANQGATAGLLRDLRISMIRPIVSRDGFRERLVRFWADHFTVAAKGKGLRYVTTGYIEEAIRPCITGSFATLFKSASLHPAMLIYLDQIQSTGPNSRIGRRKNRGLNENLAREAMELHSLGVGATYTQKDVREFAKLLTGLFYNFRTGFRFRPQAAEPGIKTVLGKQYGGDEPRLSDIYAAFDDLAVHPDTARHIARKLVVHFVSETPDVALVDHVAKAYSASGGDLMATYTALLNHPAAWEGFGGKAKQPFAYMVSAMRAMNVKPHQIDTLSVRKTRRYLAGPLQVMGQPWLSPPGPDGWPEGVEDWITPQGLAARIEWALMASGALGKRLEPRDLAVAALGDAAGWTLPGVVGSAESRVEGVALVLASPEFNRC